jgi:diguanylate cyclase
VQASENPKRVLLVDDERQQFLLVGYLLSEAHCDNYRLIWCQDLEKGLDHIEHHECDVVLLDYHWGISGSDFIKRAQLLNNRIPIIIMTDDMELEVDRKAISEGASDYLVKDNLNSDVLERTIRYSMERKNIEQHLEYLAHYDYLTGLPNRVLFLDRLNQTVNLAKRSNNQFTLMYIDLNDFKVVNDNYGHDVGDGLLKEFAHRLQDTVRRSDTVARIGGDEFTIILNDLGSTPKIIYFAQKLIENIERPFIIANNTLSVGCSIGIAVFPDAGDQVDVLQRNADMSMYQAKQTGNNCYRFFVSHKKENIVIEHLSPDKFISLSKENKFTLHFTPRIDLKTNRIVGVVVSPVWQQADGILRLYDEFASVMGNGETIKLLTEWMLDASLSLMQKRYKKYAFVFSYAVRRPELQSSRFGAYVAGVVEKYHINMSDMEFSFLRKKECGQDVFLKECIENIHDIGAHFCLKDFGENTLSLQHMHNYDVSSLHFSSGFLKAAIKNKKDALLLETLIMLAHRLGRTVVADGIETSEHLDFMSSLGCDQAQGGIVGENFSLAELDAHLKKHNVPLKTN